jgi:hypothetical protein
LSIQQESSNRVGPGAVNDETTEIVDQNSVSITEFSPEATNDSDDCLPDPKRQCVDALGVPPPVLRAEERRPSNASFNHQSMNAAAMEMGLGRSTLEPPPFTGHDPARSTLEFPPFGSSSPRIDLPNPSAFVSGINRDFQDANTNIYLNPQQSSSDFTDQPGSSQPQSLLPNPLLNVSNGDPSNARLSTSYVSHSATLPNLAEQTATGLNYSYRSGELINPYSTTGPTFNDFPNSYDYAPFNDFPNSYDYAPFNDFPNSYNYTAHVSDFSEIS